MLIHIYNDKANYGIPGEEVLRAGFEGVDGSEAGITWKSGDAIVYVGF